MMKPELTAAEIANADTTIHVLLVDDQPIIAEGIRRMLENENDIQLHYCEDPGKAIETAQDVNATLILQDLVMPDIDGMTLVRFYRANHNTRDIPVIVLSSKDDPEIKSDAFSHGASDYLVKLPDKIELIARIRAHAKNYIMQVERDAAFFALREIKKQLEVSNRKLRKLSMLDGLTGISNRRHFDETLADELRTATQTGATLALVLMDIDYFKNFNDEHGHLMGDECLKRVASTISLECTHSNDLVARYGGEEFVVILPETTEEEAQKVAERMRKAVEELCVESPQAGKTLCVKLSLGVATTDTEARAEVLIHLADQALYQAKENGRNQVVLASNLPA